MLNFKFSFWSSTLVLSMIGSGLAVLSCLVFTCESASFYMSWPLWEASSLELELVILLDCVSSVFMFTVFLITSSVYLFSLNYMGEEKFFDRFHLILFSFVASMILLILSPSLLSALIGWDGLGVSSYFLVIYYSSTKAYNAGMITALTNRLGDSFMLVALAFYIPWGDLSFFWYSNFWAGSSDLIFFLILGAFTKSAQIPFSAWLPAAMAAPTPVSSLVHSSTLVTAGVYVLIRHLKSLPFMSGLFVSSIGVSTMFMASFSAFFELDMKKIIALSTLSQLGVMVLSLGLNSPTLAFVHLIAHAFFKAMLFIATGNMIHASGDYQALKKSGGLLNILPCSFAANVTGSLSLAGFPFMSAFFSKEPIIELSMESEWSSYLYIFMMAGVAMTAGYSLRLVGLTSIFSNSGSSLKVEAEGGSATLLSLSSLFLLAIVGGNLCYVAFVLAPQAPMSPLFNKLVVIFLLFLGATGSIYISSSYLVSSKFLATGGGMWCMPFFSGYLLNSPVQSISLVSRSVDQAWVWGALPEGGKISKAVSGPLLSSLMINHKSVLLAVGAGVLVLSLKL